MRENDSCYLVRVNNPLCPLPLFPKEFFPSVMIKVSQPTEEDDDLLDYKGALISLISSIHTVPVPFIATFNFTLSGFSPACNMKGVS